MDKAQNRSLTDNQFLNLIIENPESMKKYLKEIVIIYEQIAEVSEELTKWLKDYNPSFSITSEEAVRLRHIFDTIDNLPKQKQAIKEKISMGISTH